MIAGFFQFRRSCRYVGRYVSPEEAEIERFWHIGWLTYKALVRRFNYLTA